MFFFLIIKIEFFSNSYFGVDNSKKYLCTILYKFGCTSTIQSLISYNHQLIAYEAPFTIIIVSSARRKCTRSPSCSCRKWSVGLFLIVRIPMAEYYYCIIRICIIWCKVLIYSKLRKCTLFAHLKTCVFFAYIIYLHDISYTWQLESMLSLRSFA